MIERLKDRMIEVLINLLSYWSNVRIIDYDVWMIKGLDD